MKMHFHEISINLLQLDDQSIQRRGSKNAHIAKKPTALEIIKVLCSAHCYNKWKNNELIVKIPQLERISHAIVEFSMVQFVIMLVPRDLNTHFIRQMIVASTFWINKYKKNLMNEPSNGRDQAVPTQHYLFEMPKTTQLYQGNIAS